MASETEVNACFDALIDHFPQWIDPEDLDTENALWVRELSWASGYALEQATAQTLRHATKMPVLADFLVLVRGWAAQPVPEPVDAQADLTPEDQAARREWVTLALTALDVWLSGDDPEAMVLPPPPVAGKREHFECPCGEGRGWVEAGERMVRPCERCRPATYANWLNGAYS